MKPLLRGASACALLAALSPPAWAQEPPATVVVTARAGLPDIPTTSESVSAAELARTTNLVTPEDALRYLPSLFVRQRHFGDTQSPLATRTSGVGSSARSLIYVDGILLSALIGNNNTSASPKWALVNPDAIARVDVLYGPFAAAFPGNSIGAVVSFTTRMPDRFEAQAELQGAGQDFALYGDRSSFGTGRAAASVGDRLGRLAFRFSYNHLETDAQPLTYALAPSPSGPGGTVATGAVAGANRTGAPILYLGSTALEHQAQDNLSGRLTYDLTPTLTAAYTFGLFRNLDHAGVNSYLRDPAGTPVYAGAVTLAGRGYALPAALFSGGVYHFEEDQLAQGLSLASHTGGTFDFDLTGSRFDYLKSRQRIPSGALPGALNGGPGSTTSLDGTGWTTLDASGTWRRPAGRDGAHIVTFGAHGDAFHLNTPRYALSDWIAGSAGATQSFSRGRTATQALWVQDEWRIAAPITATLGGRWEHWNAYDGLNFSASPALNRIQPAEGAWRFSPKGVLALTPVRGWTLKGSLGVAYRFPTVSELYQAVTAGPILAVPNPNLRPEDALSGEISLEHGWSGGRARVSLFGERILDALVSQTGSLPGVSQPATFVQNIDRVRTRGVEAVAAQDDVLVKGLSLSGSITYVDARTVTDIALPAANGKRLPQVPPLRATAVASWTPTPRFSATLAARYSDRSPGTIDNSDSFANTYTGFGAYFVLDAHLRYQFTRHIAGEIGCENLTDRAYFEYHPFPQRTIIGSVKYVY